MAYITIFRMFKKCYPFFLENFIECHTRSRIFNLIDYSGLEKYYITESCCPDCISNCKCFSVIFFRDKIFPGSFKGLK